MKIIYKFPEKDELEDILSTTYSSSNINEYNNKLYVDDYFGNVKLISVTVEYAHLNGEWDIELKDYEMTNEYELRLIYRHADNVSMSFGFTNIMSRKRFIEGLTLDKEICQISSGMNLEKLVNTNVVKQAAIFSGIVAIGYGIFKLFIPPEQKK